MSIHHMTIGNHPLPGRAAPGRRLCALLHDLRLVFIAAVALMASTSALAQSRQIPAPPQSQPIVVAGATIHTISGPTLADGYVVFREGRITDVGQGDHPQIENATVINA